MMIDDYDWWLWLMIMIDDYELWLMIMIIDHWLTNIRRCVFQQSLRRVKFSKKNTFYKKTFYERRKLQKLVFFCDFVYPES